MKKKFRLWLLGVWRWYRHRSLYVIADPADNSITLSRALFEHMDVMNQQQAKVFVFKISSVATADSRESKYAFTLNPQFDQPTQLCDIQYNSRHRSIGFETLCPTVNRILYDYALPTCKTKLSVDIATTPPASAAGPATTPPASAAGITYYIILRPNDITTP